MFVNVPFNNEDHNFDRIRCTEVADRVQVQSWNERRLQKLLRKRIGTGSVNRSAGRGRRWIELRVPGSAQNVISLVTSEHRHISQYLKSEGILEFVGCHLVASSIDRSHPPRGKQRSYSAANVCSGSAATQH